MPDRPDVQSEAIILRAVGHACAVPLADVSEVMRPLPIEALAGMPPFVLGLAMIRGRATPVVELARLLGDECSPRINRFVTLRAGERFVALAVESVDGVRALDKKSFESMPALLGSERAEVVASVATLDSQFLLVLRAARLIPEEHWAGLAAAEARV